MLLQHGRAGGTDEGVLVPFLASPQQASIEYQELFCTQKCCNSEVNLPHAMTGSKMHFSS